MIWFSFARWSGDYGRFLVQERIYGSRGWTPFVRVRRRPVVQGPEKDRPA
jgi:hypothetical protein